MRRYAKPFFTGNGKCSNSSGMKMLYTEAQTLEDAVGILLDRQKTERRREAQSKATHHNVSIRFRQAASARMRAHQLERRNKPKTPHPFRDLTDEGKRLKMRAMFETGMWGIRTCAAERLAKKFAVPVGQAVLWLEDCEQRL